MVSVDVAASVTVTTRVAVIAVGAGDGRLHPARVGSNMMVSVPAAARSGIEKHVDGKPVLVAVKA